MGLGHWRFDLLLFFIFYFWVGLGCVGLGVLLGKIEEKYGSYSVEWAVLDFRGSKRAAQGRSLICLFLGLGSCSASGFSRLQGFHSFEKP